MFLKKKDKGDGFEKLNVGGGSNGVSFTVVLNLGKLNDTNEIATINISRSNEEPSILTGSRREEMMQKPTQQEKEPNPLTTKKRFTSSQVPNAVYKRHQLLHGLPPRTR
jgi:hypothetical protein